MTGRAQAASLGLALLLATGGFLWWGLAEPPRPEPPARPTGEGGVAARPAAEEAPVAPPLPTEPAASSVEQASAQARSEVLEALRGGVIDADAALQLESLGEELDLPPVAVERLAERLSLMAPSEQRRFLSDLATDLPPEDAL